MKFLERRFEIDGRQGELEIDLYADTHFGSKNVDEELLKKHIRETKENNRYWCFLGDAIDGILPPDRRFNPKNIEDWAWEAHKEDKLIQAEWEHFIEIFKPIKDSCLFFLDGDGKHNKSFDVADCMTSALNSIGITNIDQTIYLKAQIARNTTTYSDVPLVFHHGWFAGRKSGSKINNLTDSLNFFPEAWGFFCGHGHTKVTIPPQVGIVERAGKCQSLYRRAAMTGSYLKTYAENSIGYGEVKLYPPVALGRITLVIRPFHHDDQKRLEIMND